MAELAITDRYAFVSIFAIYSDILGSPPTDYLYDYYYYYFSVYVLARVSSDFDFFIAELFELKWWLCRERLDGGFEDAMASALSNRNVPLCDALGVYRVPLPLFC